MKLYAVLLFLAVCGLAVTPSLAASGPDKVISVEGETLILEHAGSVRLAHLYLPDASVLAEFKGMPVKVQPQGTDRYGHRLAILTHDNEPLQVTLLRAGTALIYDAGGFRQLKSWQAAEEEAQTARRGLWAKPALAPEETFGYRHRFVRVAGTVTRTYKARDAYYINFGDDWKTDFSLSIPRSAWRAFGKDFTIADGTKLEARGVLVEENGPMLMLTRPEQLEIR